MHVGRRWILSLPFRPVVRNGMPANLLHDVRRNNWLSSGRREAGLKVQILFAPPASPRFSRSPAEDSKIARMFAHFLRPEGTGEA
jgi:hypothetical protein